MVVAQWSAGLPSTPTIRIRISLVSTVFVVQIAWKEQKINEYFETGKTTYDGLITKFVRFLNHNFDDWNDTCQA